MYVCMYIVLTIFQLIGMDGRNYCSRTWGSRLRRRLNRIETWAEKQGLELAADCHLVRVVQAAHLLQVSVNCQTLCSSSTTTHQNLLKLCFGYYCTVFCNLQPFQLELTQFLN
jgi:site-specific recombinase XerC